MEKIEKLNNWADKVKNGEVVKGYPYDGCMVAVEKAIIEYGAENIFYVNRSYRSMYYDDYCTFYYYNNITGETFTDEWTTAAACPGFGRYENAVTLDEAFENNLVNKQMILDKARPKYIELINNIDFEISTELAVAAHLRVKVEGGRKWKGTGLLVGTFATSYQYAHPSFYTDDSSFGCSTVRHAKIWDVVENTVNVCSYAQVKFVDYPEMRKKYIECLTEWVNGLTTDDITTITISTPKELSWDKFVIAHFSILLPETPTWRDKYAEAEAEKKRAFRERKIADLTEWAKTCTDIPEEEIPAFVERVYKKKYE